MTLLDSKLGVGYLRGDSAHVSSRTAVVAHPYFTRSAGEVLDAYVAFRQVPRSAKPRQAAAKLGLRFESKVLKSLKAQFGSRFGSHIYFSFTSLTEPGRFAIPDGLLLSSCRTTLLVTEIKLSHSGDAFHQLNNFYLPIVRKALPCLRIAALEIVHYYDPRVVLPKQKALVAHPTEAFSLRDCFHPVLIADSHGNWL
jgi:hypothetical protein